MPYYTAVDTASPYLFVHNHASNKQRATCDLSQFVSRSPPTPTTNPVATECIQSDAASRSLANNGCNVYERESVPGGWETGVLGGGGGGQQMHACAAGPNTKQALTTLSLRMRRIASLLTHYKLEKRVCVVCIYVHVCVCASVCVCVRALGVLLSVQSLSAEIVSHTCTCTHTHGARAVTHINTPHTARRRICLQNDTNAHAHARV